MTTATSTLVDETVTEPIGPGPADEAVEADLLVEDLLVEDVSIDGMCGVY